MAQRGFIFSLDAFVAFTLTMITISLLIFTIGTPKPYYYSLEQAHQLAHDTLQVLATSSDNATQGTYLERVLSGSGSDVNEIMFRVAGGRENNLTNGSRAGYLPIIPKGYGYRLERYQFASDKWSILYDSGDGGDSYTVKGCTFGSDRCGRRFTKLSASATTFGSIYTILPAPGESPYCYLSCQGYYVTANGSGSYQSPCNVTPCDAPKSNFRAGNNSIAIVRLTVYT